MKTYTVRKEDVKRDWYVIDAEGKNLGRLAALIANVLRGKHKPYFQKDVENICEAFLTYLTSSPFLKLGIEVRRRRILKICTYRPNLEDLKKTLSELSILLNADPHQKTLVFTIKMLNYTYMCSRGIKRVAPTDIPIPVDYRVAYLTWCAGLIDLMPEKAMKRYREVQSVWDKVAQLAGIPPLHIDTVLWLTGRAVLYGENMHNVPDYLIRVFEKRGGCTHFLKSG